MTSIADEVNHPTHYRASPSGIECITVVEHMSFLRGNAMKYLWRAGEKQSVDMVTDLRKAIWYIQREIEKIERDKL
jgi:hypothetical protein